MIKHVKQAHYDSYSKIIYTNGYATLLIGRVMTSGDYMRISTYQCCLFTRDQINGKNFWTHIRITSILPTQSFITLNFVADIFFENRLTY